MAYVVKRKADLARGKIGKWTCRYLGPDGKWKSKAGTTDRAESQKIANNLEAEATLIREGLIDPAERSRRQASLRAIADHVEDYRLDMLAKEDTPKHAADTANSLNRLFAQASCSSVGDLAPDRIRSALGRMRAGNLSARRCNFILAAAKAFAKWLEHNNRIDEVPRGLSALRPYNEKEDRRRVRRALTKDEVVRLLWAAEQGAPIEAIRGPGSTRKNLDPAGSISGPERALLYRLAMGTGFRADELRTLTPERFALDGDAPTVTVLACYSKNGKEAVQPITRQLAGHLKPLLEGKERGRPVVAVPIKTAKMLRFDLAVAGIPYRDQDGAVLDFHALRTTYITQLILDGVNPKSVQSLARHSTITLTLDRYTKVTPGDIRKALEGESSDEKPSDPKPH